MEKESKKHGTKVGHKVYKQLFPKTPCLTKDIDFINLDHFYKKNKGALKMSKPEDQTHLLEKAAHNHTKCTFGSFLEDRTELWSEVYDDLKKNEKLIHLGIDINNVHVGQEVTSLTEGVVVHSMHDRAPQKGWGGLILIKKGTGPKAVYIMYAHLDARLAAKGTKVSPGSVIGYIGNPKVNGGWFPHLHLQVMGEKYMKTYKGDFGGIHGYNVVKKSRTAAAIKKSYENAGLIDPVEFIQSL